MSSSRPPLSYLSRISVRFEMFAQKVATIPREDFDGSVDTIEGAECKLGSGLR
jgi:hypothetical protein